ncbi:hypothetical protein ACN42_g4618 [Penicillium freii]|uniref:Uncharacterized protein n=1 Tax=Penicillium freii TaxID=48697 RepID=A0A101MKY4_PENFR|nr:hypothetical protein ACN42_g4618 [Penicillium freii]
MFEHSRNRFQPAICEKPTQWRFGRVVKAIDSVCSTNYGHHRNTILILPQKSIPFVGACSNHAAVVLYPFCFLLYQRTDSNISFFLFNHLMFYYPGLKAVLRPLQLGTNYTYINFNMGNDTRHVLGRS